MNEMKESSEESLPPRAASFPAKRRFVRLGRKMRDGSQLSASPTCRPAELVVVRQPSKSRIHRHANRLSGVFLRPDSMALTAGLRSSRSVHARKGSMVFADALQVDDPSELSNQITAPGILKIFGNEICEGAHYKSVLATTQSSAKELVKEALERYGLSKEEAESYVLCDTIGSIDNHQWRTEGFRVVGDHEKPLLLQSLWKPREGLARRFEIQRKRLVEEKRSKEKDTITAGINAQARKLQKSRSRVTSTLVEKTVGRSQKLWRSKSEMDLLDTDTQHDTDHDGRARDLCLDRGSVQSYFQTSPEQNHIHGLAAPSEGDGRSGAKTETLCVSGPRGEREGEESEREETESSDDNTTQYSIHPPQDCPYLLLLQGCSLAQDFVIYLLAASDIVIGCHDDRTTADILLFAADILPKHCCFHRHSAAGPIVLSPCEEAVVRRNGVVLENAVQLNPGDIIGLGQHYTFLFKDPLAVTHKEANGAPPASPWILNDSPSAASTSLNTATILCNSYISTCTDFHSIHCTSPPFLKSPEGHNLTLSFEAGDEDDIIKQIVAMGDGSGCLDRPQLTVSFLLCMCIQYSSSYLQTSDLRRLLLLIASRFQSTIWEHTKDLAAVQPEVLSGKDSHPEDLQPLSLCELISGLRPLVVWMSNSLELLQFIQHQLPLILEWRNQKEPWEDEESQEVRNLELLELHLPCIRSASEDTVAVLEEVIMLAFQQCVYYVTKFLYPVLPGLLECNPFSESTDPRAYGDRTPVLGDGEVQVPGEIRQVVEVLNESWTLLSDSQVHPEISSQLIGYLFYFINASLFNSLMERGSEPGFYQWSRGVRARANLDLLLDWAHAAGLGELALEHTHSLSSAINLLATPRKNLLQTSWVSLRSDYPALNPAQLNHLLSFYSPASPCRHTWTPSAPDRAAAQKTADVLESFDTHHPLVLPDEGYQLQLRKAVMDSALREQLSKLEEFITGLSDSRFNVTAEHQGGTAQMEAGTAVLHNTDTSPADLILSQATFQNCPSPSTTSSGLPPSPSSPIPAPKQEAFISCGVHILSQKLITLELQTAETESSDLKRSRLDPTCLLTPPNTPHTIHPSDLLSDSERTLHSSAVDPNSKDGLVFECLAALKTDRLRPNCQNPKRLGELQEEDEEEEADYKDDEVFSLELERGDRGLGLALVDTRDTSFKVKGVFIRAVVPDSPAAQCQQLEPGDRILAVNGVSLLGMDYQSGRELIRSSGSRLRLLVARSHCIASTIQTEC